VPVQKGRSAASGPGSQNEQEPAGQQQLATGRFKFWRPLHTVIRGLSSVGSGSKGLRLWFCTEQGAQACFQACCRLAHAPLQACTKGTDVATSTAGGGLVLVGPGPPESAGMGCESPAAAALAPPVAPAPPPAAAAASTPAAPASAAAAPASNPLEGCVLARCGHSSSSVGASQPTSSHQSSSRAAVWWYKPAQELSTLQSCDLISLCVWAFPRAEGIPTSRGSTVRAGVACPRRLDNKAEEWAACLLARTSQAGPLSHVPTQPPAPTSPSPSQLLSHAGG